ncbi:MAG TPA: hypothetical protein VNK96_06970 [Fimbriimonadales bacterium]|nr:hypothetical protein [Fimbriimonadales bacterium]
MMKYFWRLSFLFATSSLLAVQIGTTERVSLSSSGEEGYGDSFEPSISADGNYVAFVSAAPNLVPEDTNDVADIFVHDRQAGVTIRVSVSSAGAQANNFSWQCSINDDGRYVAFTSTSTNLVSESTGLFDKVFVHDTQTGVTTLVSVSSSGTPANDSSVYPSLSGDGRYVAFTSYAPNLVSGDTNNVGDVFVHDRNTGQTTRVSVSSSGEQGNGISWLSSISADGRYVAFTSYASNLVSGDTNGFSDVFVHDRQTGQTTRVSVSSSGEQGNEGSFLPSISADGRYVAFSSLASNLVSGDTNGKEDVFIHDIQTGQTTRVSISSSGAQGNDFSWAPSISANGRYVAFSSEASNLVSGDTNYSTDAFVHDRQTGLTIRVSISSSGKESYGDSVSPSISAKGRYIAFSSYAYALVSNDTNGFSDVFVHMPAYAASPIVKPPKG